MECPLCKKIKPSEITCDGFAKNVNECDNCGGVWLITNNTITIIKGRVPKRQKVYTNFVCPTCHGMVSNEIDLDAFQFHEELYECDSCGTICSVIHDKIIVINDSQKGSFLETTGEGELVEADDYILM